jgi:hypothetical protein
MHSKDLNTDKNTTVPEGKSPVLSNDELAKVNGGGPLGTIAKAVSKFTKDPGGASAINNGFFLAAAGSIGYEGIGTEIRKHNEKEKQSNS